MVRQAWTGRIAPPLLVAAVVGCVWYALQGQPKPLVAAVLPKASTGSADTKSPVADAQPVIVPTVAASGGQVQFSIATKPYMHVQKVEFYVENTFVGTAYSQPYSVVVSENDLTAGNNSVTAKVYTDTATTETPAATFVATPTVPPAPIATDDTTNTTAPSDNDTTTDTPPPPPVIPTIAAPTDVTVTAVDSTDASLGWTGVGGAVSYQIWRDGNLVGTATDTSYIDPSLNQGQTYDYQIVAMDADGNVSDYSDTAVITMPTDPPPQESVVNPPPSDSGDSAQTNSTST